MLGVQEVLKALGMLEVQGVAGGIRDARGTGSTGGIRYT